MADDEKAAQADATEQAGATDDVDRPAAELSLEVLRRARASVERRDEDVEELRETITRLESGSDTPTETLGRLRNRLQSLEEEAQGIRSIADWAEKLREAVPADTGAAGDDAVKAAEAAAEDLHNKVKSLDGEVAKLKSDLETEKSKRFELEGERLELRKELDDAKEKAAGGPSPEAADELNRKLKSLEGELSSVKTNLQDERAKRSSAETERLELKKKLDETPEVPAPGSDAAVEQLQAEVATLRGELDSIKASREETRAKLSQAEEDRRTAETALRAVEEKEATRTPGEAENLENERDQLIEAIRGRDATIVNLKKAVEALEKDAEANAATAVKAAQAAAVSAAQAATPAKPVDAPKAEAAPAKEEPPARAFITGNPRVVALPKLFNFVSKDPNAAKIAALVLQRDMTLEAIAETTKIAPEFVRKSLADLLADELIELSD